MQPSTFYNGGFFLVEGTTQFSTRLSTLPAMLWTVSSCICALYPDSWAYAWATVAQDTVVEVQQRLRLHDAQFASLRAECDQALDTHVLGWPGVWLDLTAARTFYQTYLPHLEHIKLIALGIPAFSFEDALCDLAPPDGSTGGGIYQCLKQRQVLPNEYVVRGYEILGSAYGTSFHSFYCNGLEQAYQDVLHLPFNTYGLIEQYESAQQATDYTNLETTGAEPVAWYPWLVVEYSL